MLGKTILLNGFACLLIGGISQTLDVAQESPARTIPEDFNPAKKTFKKCIDVITNIEQGTRWYVYPATYEAKDEWVKSGHHDAKYTRRWVVVEPARSIEIVVGSIEDKTLMTEENICQE